jgi:hypothetical protein
MRRLLALLAPLTLLLGGLDAAPAAASALAHYRFLDSQVFGTVAVGMPDQRTVKIQHLDPATGQWDAPSVLWSAPRGVTCGELDGRAASPTGPGVALLVACDAPYYEDQAPTHSVALVTTDGRSWHHRRLNGEAYLDPAISPSATYAAWLVRGIGEYVEWSAATGFAPIRQTTYRWDSGGETLVVDDGGTVSVLGPEPQGRSCVVGVHTRDLAGTQTHTVVPGVDPGCTEGALSNVDANTVTGGGSERAERFTLARSGPGAPWTLAAGRPSEAPGLVHYGYGPKRIATHYLESSVPGSPLVALGGPDRRHLLLQRFDDATRTWLPQQPLYTSPRPCRPTWFYTERPPALYVDELRCGRHTVVVASPDAATWTVRDVGRRPWALTGDAVALPGRATTTVVSSTGVQLFPGSTAGRCDVVQPGRPGELVRLHGRGWPTKVQVSTGGRFETVSTARRVPVRCRRVLVESSVQPPAILLQSVRGDRFARLVLRRGTWRLAYPRTGF